VSTREEQRERFFQASEARTSNYRGALAHRDQLANAAADEFGRRDLADAERRLNLARYSCEFWGDPLADEAKKQAAPEASTSQLIESTPPEPLLATLPTGVASGVDTAEAVVARILISDRVPGEGRENAEVDAIARRIAEA